MTDWLNTRQKAVDDAKRQTPHQGVQVWHYSEVNHVTNISMAGRPSVTNNVLPKTNVDYVSYSTYDSLGDIAKHLPKALNYIEANFRPSLASMASGSSSGSMVSPPDNSRRRNGTAGHGR